MGYRKKDLLCRTERSVRKGMSNSDMQPRQREIGVIEESRLHIPYDNVGRVFELCFTSVLRDEKE